MGCFLDMIRFLQPIASDFEHNRVDEARNKFQQLANSDKNEIYRIIWLNSWSKGGDPNPHPRYGELAFEGREFQISNNARAEAIGCYINSLLTGYYLQIIAEEFRENCNLSQDLRYIYIRQACVQFDQLQGEIKNSIYFHVWKLIGNADSDLKFGENEFKKNLDGIQSQSIENYLVAFHPIFKIEREKKKSSGVLSSSDKAHQQFDLVIKDVSSLLILPKNCQILVCKRIRRVVNDLDVQTNTLVSGLTKKDLQLRSELINTIRDSNKAKADLEAVQSKLYHYESELKGLRSKEEDIENEIRVKQMEIFLLKEEIKAQPARLLKSMFESAIDHFFGRINFIQYVEKIISALNRTLEITSRDLDTKNKEIDGLRKKINFVDENFCKQKSELSKYFHEIQRLEHMISSKEADTKYLGQHLTYLRDINMSLKCLLIKYKFLNMEVELVQDIIEEFDLLEESTVLSLTNEVQTLKQFYSKYMYYSKALVF